MKIRMYNTDNARFLGSLASLEAAHGFFLTPPELSQICWSAVPLSTAPAHLSP